MEDMQPIHRRPLSMMGHVYNSGQQSPVKEKAVGSVASVIDGGFKGFSDSDEEDNKVDEKFQSVSMKAFTPVPVLHKREVLDKFMEPPFENKHQQE